MSIRSANRVEHKRWGKKRMKEIVILDGYTINPGDLSWKPLETFAKLTVYDRTLQEEAVSRIGSADAVLTSKILMTAELMAACPNLKYIGVLATGTNTVDLQAAAEHGITVTNVPAYSTRAVAQFVFALLLEVCNQVGHHNQAVQAGRWAASQDFCFWEKPLLELSGKTMGIIGFGAIGQAVAGIARAMGMKVLAFSRTKKNVPADLADQTDLDRLLKEADVLSLHLPLTAATEGFIDADRLAQVKPGVIMINTARGPIVDENAMARALAEDKVYYYATDVVSVEPIRRDNPLLTAPRCIMTPHIAWAPQETRSRLLDIVVENVRCYALGKPINVVS